MLNIPKSYIDRLGQHFSCNVTAVRVEAYPSFKFVIKTLDGAETFESLQMVLCKLLEGDELREILCNPDQIILSSIKTEFAKAINDLNVLNQLFEIKEVEVNPFTEETCNVILCTVKIDGQTFQYFVRMFSVTVDNKVKVYLGSTPCFVKHDRDYVKFRKLYSEAFQNKTTESFIGAVTCDVAPSDYSIFLETADKIQLQSMHAGLLQFNKM